MTFKMAALTWILFARSLCVWAADGRIVGRLTDPQGAVVAGAKLRLTTKSGAPPLEAVSDKDGRFVFATAPPGDYVIRASAAGFDDIKQTVHVGDGEGLRVDLQFAHPAARVETVTPQLSGTVVDTSGAVIAGATVQVRSANGTVQRTTQSDANGSFVISGLSAGNYQLVVSNPGFATKETPVTLGTTEAPAPLRISLAVSPVSSTITVNGRADDLVGIAVSATQGTVGATEIQDRPILRSGEVLETVPGLIITQHAGGGKANQYFLARLQSRPRHRFRHFPRRYAA